MSQIRLATETDLRALEQLDAHGSAGWTSEAFANELKLGWSRVWVCEVAGQVRGFIVTWSVADEIQILNLATDPKHRRQGIARSLLVAVTKLADEEHKSRVTLEVRRSNLGAQLFYAALGFRQVAERKGYYSDGEDALLLDLDLLTK